MTGNADETTIKVPQDHLRFSFAQNSLDRLPRDSLLRMQEAGSNIVECYRILAKTGDNIVGELIKNVDTFFEWNHYPDGDVYDAVTHSQYYYHAHPPEERPGEHGHFHTFLRPGGMPPGTDPSVAPDYASPDDPDDALSHLIAISMDTAGLPKKLFTTNRWVTGEVWYKAKDVNAMLDFFDIDHAQPSWPVNIWISSMVCLFKPQIEALVLARDDVVAQWIADHPDENTFEDRNLEVTSELDIDVDSQIERIERALSG